MKTSRSLFRAEEIPYHRAVKRLSILLVILLVLPVVAEPGSYSVVNQGREGQQLRVEDYVRRGKTTVIFFQSRSCPHCQALLPYLKNLAESREDLNIAGVVVDRPEAVETDWGSPLARQYRYHSLPHFQIYDESGQLQAKGQAARRRINRMLMAEGLI